MRPFVPRVMTLFSVAIAACALSVTVLIAQPATPQAIEFETTLDVQAPTEGIQFVPLTFPVAIEASRYANPFDAGDIELIGVFEADDGQQRVVPGFWMQPYEDQCQSACAAEDLQPVGEPVWQVRFTPDVPGEWQYSLQVRDDGVLVDELEGQFLIRESTRRGFVRIADNKRYFRYDNGLPFFPIGHNLSWSWEGVGGLYAYERWFQELSAAGGNYARVYIDVPWFIGLEWEAAGDYSARQDDAARLDAILAMAEDYGIALQLVLLWHQGLSTYNGAPLLIPDEPPAPDTSLDWDDHPYNVVNGGPLSGPTAFFFEPEGTELFRRRLRYIVARWGYSPQVFAWEVVDEIDGVTASDENLVNTWLQESVSYLKQIDAHRHLITAGSREPRQSLTSNPLLDFTTIQYYQRAPIETPTNHETALIDRVRFNMQLRDAPTLVASHSLNPWYAPTETDPDGIHLQTSLWAAALAGAGGGAMSAWGDSYVTRADLERYYTPLAAFAAGVDWGGLTLQPAEGVVLVGDSTDYGPVRVDGFNRQFREELPSPAPRAITPEGVVPSLENVSSFLYGQAYNTALRQTQTYSVAVPVDTYLEIAIRAVSDQASARLLTTVNGVVASDVALGAGSQGAVVRIPLTAGEHTIELSNTGEDWLSIEYLEVGQLTTSVRVLTLRDSEAGVALVWLQHRDYAFEQLSAGVTLEPVDVRYRLGELPSGNYLVELWDPLNGAVLGEEIVRVGDDGTLSVDLLPLDDQLALRIFHQPVGEATAPVISEPSSEPTSLAPPAETSDTAVEGDALPDDILSGP